MAKDSTSGPGPASDAQASSARRYSRGAIALHWTTALLVLSTIPIGWYGASFESDFAQSATNLHKSIGILILLLTVARIAWRLTHRPPPLPIAYPRSLRRIATVVHFLFYGLLLILPLSGWWVSSAVPIRHPFSIGPWQVPFLPVPRAFASAGPAHAVHVNLGWAMAVLIVLHVAAALRHHIIDRDDILARMLPLRRQTPAPRGSPTGRQSPEGA